MASADKESLCPKNRLKLLCSYGGKILPRPSDGQLKYVGGETRVLAVARSISFPGESTKPTANSLSLFFLFGMTMTVVAMMMLAELKKRIKEMFNIAEVVIKHQIMPEDLDLLVSVTCDEDLRHMLDEYDRHDSRCPSNSPRFRLFLFSSVPPRFAPFSDAAAAASSIEQRYLEAINGVPPAAGLSLFAISTSAATSPTSNTNLRHPFLAAQTNHLSTSAGGGQGLHRVQSTPHLGQGLHRVRSTPNLGVATRSQMANGMGPSYGGHQQQQQQPHHHHHHYHDGLQAQPSAYGGGGGGPWRTESGPVRYVACGCGCGCRVAQPPPHVVGSHYSHAARSGGCVCLGHVDDPAPCFRRGPARLTVSHSVFHVVRLALLHGNERVISPFLSVLFYFFPVTHKGTK